MRCRWCGDIGDFGKYGLLRTIFGRPEDCKGSGLTMAVEWCRNTSIQGSGYVRVPEQLRPLDANLYDALAGMCENDRCLLTIRELAILPTKQFHYTPLSGLTRARRRCGWLTGAFERTNGAAVVFIDPDTGIATQSMEDRPNNSPKHIYVDEIQRFFNRKQSLIVYQHELMGPNQPPPPLQIRSLAARLHEVCIPRDRLRVFWWQKRFFITIVHPIHDTELNRALNEFNHSDWVTTGNFTEETHWIG